MALLKLSLAALSTLAVYGLTRIVRHLIKPFRSPLRVLQGPPCSSLLWGNLKEIIKADATCSLYDTWTSQYGKVIKYNGLLGDCQLLVMDTKAMNHVFTHSIDYQKPAEARIALARLLGDGILVTEGEKHRQQRRIMNPSFGPSSIKELTPIFFQKALQLRDIWKSDIESYTETKTSGGKNIEVLSWLSRTTLDVIGLAGFDYRLDALNVHKEPGALNKAFTTLFEAENAISVIQIILAVFPFLQIFPTKRLKEEQAARKTMRQIGEELLSVRKARAEGGGDSGKQDGSTRGKDLLSVLVRANMDTELPESQRMVDEDVLAQVPTFLIAGHETTSTETMWALFALAQRPELQSRLRAELKCVATDTPTADDLNAENLPFLDAVIRETLRVHAAVHSSFRIAMKDDVIPVSEPYFDRYGNKLDGISIKKGEAVYLPILAINCSKDIWGEDAEEFNPDRWANTPAAAHDIPGVWGNMLTFLGGARSCIGYRFALLEMKALLFTLLRKFEFGLALPADSFEKRSMIVARPYIRGEIEKGAQMPLIVKLCDL